MGQFDSWDELVQHVEDEGNLATVALVDLRDLAGWDRLTKATLAAIDDGAKQSGLGYFPRPLPSQRHADVRMYRLGTTMARLIDAVLDPTEHGDILLRETAADNASDLLERVRRLVCEE